MILIASLCMGCTSIRRKFVRKKKSQEEAQVYVTLKDYAGVPTEKAYRDYYVFVRGWLDDLKAALQEQGSWKRSKKSIDEALMNFSQIYQGLNEEGKKECQDILQEFAAIKQTVYNTSLFSSDTTRLVERVDRLKRTFEKKMSYEVVEGYLSKE